MAEGSSRFTAPEGGARLASAARHRNTLAVELAAFTSTRLIHEQAYAARGLLSSGKQRSVYITRASRVPCVAYELDILTDLAVTQAARYEDVEGWSQELEVKEVLVCTSTVLSQLLREELLTMPKINVLVIDSCHLVHTDEQLQFIMKLYKSTDQQPRVLALTYPLFAPKKTDNGDTEKADPEDVELEENEPEPDSEDVKGVEDQKEKEVGVCPNVDDFGVYAQLEWKIDQLERELACEMDLAEDIDGGKRFSTVTTKPRELIVQYSQHRDVCQEYSQLEQFMRTCVADVLQFLEEHRYDPTEIYGEDLYEEFKRMPDPTIEPKTIFKEFLYVLNEVGPYGADKAAFSLLIKLEKLKIKVPYERHFLLLCLCTTVFIKIRSHADYVFSEYSELDRIMTFSTPKVLRFIEILAQFENTEKTENDEADDKNVGDNEKTNGDDKLITNGADDLNKKKEPQESQDDRCSEQKSNVTSKMLQDIKNCDFIGLRNKLEDKVNTYEANLKEIHDLSIDNRVTADSKSEQCKNPNDDSKNPNVDSKNPNVDSKNPNVDSKNPNLDTNASKFDWKFEFDPSDPRSIFGIPRRPPRIRGRVRIQRNTPRFQQIQQNPDALCGIVFMNEPIMAKIMFLIVADLSRCEPRLSHLCAQYCAAAGAAGAPPAELRRHCRAREDALKKFRMHECNLLLATSALEEGIDLPRCNLVLRWDIPPSYRSAGLCRGRARASRAACVLLCALGEESNTLLQHACVYRELDQLISRKCGCGIQDEPPSQEEDHADSFTALIMPYSPTGGKEEDLKETPDYEYNGDDDAKRNFNDNLKSEFVEAQDDKSENSEHNVQLDINVRCNDVALESKNEVGDVRNVKDEVLVNNKSEVNSDCKHSEGKNLVGVQVDINSTKDQLEGKFSGINSDNLAEACSKCDKRTSAVIECCIEKSDSIDTLSSVKKEEIASVDLSSAIALINRYCSKLPSDTFTRLTPSCRTERVRVPAPGGWAEAFVCTLRLPLNCPVKYNIVGHPMPTRALARRVAALQACRVLHRAGELDSQLQPIGKENFKAAELETTFPDGCPDARPGTTKRRQYYYKRTARAFTDCEPKIDATEEQIRTDPPTEQNTSTNMLYCISCALWCALPERYNTRGRRLHAPQHARQAVGVLMRTGAPNSHLQIPVFPVYTRSGEVRAQVSPCAGADTRLSPRRAELVRCFMRFVFAEVLRVRRRGMSLQSEGSTHNNYYVVPTHRVVDADGSSRTDIDWKFLEQIQQYTEEKRSAELEKPMVWRPGDDDGKEDTPGKPKVKTMDNPLLKPGETFVFDAEKYREAVVTPWYRNQDQPQFFLVAEICWNLTPDSAFPSAIHKSFRDYYSSKYGVTLTQPAQPLLDVDHTSARLNLLTPRYVNRKGVALPVSSERTRRAKRDRLDQKQILVPELCCVHPFAAPLWFATVALPCVLYRINALLIADEIRRRVALDVALGIPRVEQCAGFQWPPLDFGWSLAEVLSADSEKTDNKKENDDSLEDDSEIKSEDALIENEDSTVQNEKTINDILQEKENAENAFEIGMWDNKMASSIPPTVEYDELMEPLPPNLSFCTSASGGVNWCAPTMKPRITGLMPRTFSMADSDCSYMSSDFDTDDSDFGSEGSGDTESSGFCSSKSNAAMGVRIEYKTAQRRTRRGGPGAAARAPAPRARAAPTTAPTAPRTRALLAAGSPPAQYLEKFNKSVAQHEKYITEKGLLIPADTPIVDLLPAINKEPKKTEIITEEEKRNKFEELFPYNNEFLNVENAITLEDIEKNKRALLNEFKNTLSKEEVKKLTCFSMVEVDIDSPEYRNVKISNIGFDTREAYVEKARCIGAREFKPYFEEYKGQNGKEFDFDFQPDLEGHPGPSPSVILQGLTMSNANDGINLERLETIGDSFLKFAITAYLYCAHPTVHEGKLSHMRSKQVSNLNLYRLGLRKRLGARMIASKFEPHDNWLPPCHRAPPAAHAPVDSEEAYNSQEPAPATGCFIPYNLITQHSIPDKSIADCVEALIGAYLLECGPRGALLFMAWLGIRVLPRHDVPVRAAAVVERLQQEKQKKQSRKPKKRVRHDSASSSDDDRDDMSPTRPVGSLEPYQDEQGVWILPMFGELKAPPSPLLRYIEDPEGELERMLSGYDALERTLQYRFRDRALLLQALTHASHQQNRLTDCYQRLEFLGDAILDYLITRHLYEDPRRHSPGALTDLRSALVNNTIFATLAARHGFHKYFRHMSPGLNEVLTRYVKIQEENGHSISEEHYLIHEDEMEQAEDVEVPKALGDLFESVAGAIFLDSGMSLGAVWSSYELLMGAELEAFSAAAPKSPVRELLEAEPDTAKFGKPERLADGRRVRVCVEVFGRGAFKGVGRNYRIAKGTAARCALRHLKKHKQH